ncbi:SulP family inorganic anion transporter [Paucibacter sp. R3-3]|uniref:SulP family inorganic anion transporter n=1 Tax=Roseateles agri TaxID=3098619 RepID=A0ABU5DD57_9BURK|nr:SulP family inorganic anion transporter [Paucibacter sp. R3-3]MDY0744212.1 SulP family inorganic anion transporter [Paucibacter sp. R3-3]
MKTPALRPADLIAGLSMAGLLLPEAVAYAGLARMPPQAGVMALFAGLLVYGLLGSSRFAIVSATSSSAVLLLAAMTSMTADLAPGAPDQRMALAAGLVLLTGALFVLAALARLGALSSLVAKPVLRGFSMGLALTIVLKQCPTLLGVQLEHSDFFRLAWDLVAALPRWNWGSAAVGVAGLVLLKLFSRWRTLPGALVVIALGVAFDLAGGDRLWNIPAVGTLTLHFDGLRWPMLARETWLRLGELAFALALILYAESYGSIRGFAVRHGDPVNANRDLLALGAANLLAGLLQGMPVGAGYSATSANEAAGATSKAAGLLAAAVVLLAALTLLPWIAHTPQPLLAAIVIHAVGHTLAPGGLAPYFRWRRDRLIALFAFAAVLLLGVLDGLLISIAASLALLLRSLAATRISWLGRLGDSHDFVDLARHADARAPARTLIARPDVPLFFGNADAVFAALRDRVAAASDVDRVILSLEQSPDLDGTSLEALAEFAAWVQARGQRLLLARVKDELQDLLARAALPGLPSADAYWSVDDAVVAA